MAHLNILSICVLAAVASGECFFSNLMNEPLNFAVSLLDGQSKSSPRVIEPWTTEPNSHESTMIPFTTDMPVTMSGSRGRSKNIMMAKSSIRNSFKSKPNARVESLKVSSSDSSSSGVGIIPGKLWNQPRGQKSLMASPMNSLMTRGYSGSRKVIIRPIKASRMNNRGSKKLSWFSSGMSRSDEKMPTVKAIYKPQKKMLSSRSEDNSAAFIRWDSSSSSSEEIITTPSSAKIMSPSGRAYPSMRSNSMGLSKKSSWNKIKSVRARMSRKPSSHCHICHS